MTPKEKFPFVFLTSHAFSGSTLLSFLLGSHPAIATVGELTGPAYHLSLDTYYCSCGCLFQQCPFWREVAEVVNQYQVPYSLDQYFDTRFYVNTHKLLLRLRMGSLRSNFLEAWRDRLMLALWPGHRQEMNERLRRNEVFARAILDVSGKSIFLDTSKDPMRIPFLHKSQLFDFYAIHLVRDVRGVVTSILSRHPETDVQQATRSWLWREQNIKRHLKSIPQTRQMLVRYEELATETLTTLNNVFAFLGLAKLDEIVNFRETENHILGNKMRKGNSAEIRLDERWRTVLSDAQLQTITQTVGASNLG
jgi:hypothetical protein